MHTPRGILSLLAVAFVPSVVMISVDGLRPAFYRDEPGIQYDAPTLKKLASQGASADGLEPIFPSNTYPNHATLVSGVRSNRHGIVSNTIFSLKKGDEPNWYWESRHFKAPTLWSEAKAQGKKTAILTWPTSVGASVDWLVPEIFPVTRDAGETAWDLTRKNMNPVFLKDILDHLADEDKTLEGYEQRDRWVTGASRHVLAKYHPDLTLIHLINLDHVEHETGKSSAQTRAALKIVDSQLARIIEPLDLSQTTLLIVGDHGFYEYSRIVHPNTLLAMQGWLSVKNGQIAPNWKVITHVSGGAGAIYSRDSKLNDKVIRLLKDRAEGAYRVIERPELDRLGAFPGALCALTPTTSFPGYSIGAKAQGPFIEATGQTRGNHGSLAANDPQLRSGLIAVGPGIRAGKNLGIIQNIDVAPTAAKILKIRLPASDGQPIELTNP